MFLVLSGTGYKWFDGKGKLLGEGNFPVDVVEFKEIIEADKWSDYWKRIVEKNIRILRKGSVSILVGNDLVFKKLIGRGEKSEAVLQELLGEVPFPEGKKKGRIVKQKSGTVLAVVMAWEIPETVAEMLKRMGIGVRGVFWAETADISSEGKESWWEAESIKTRKTSGWWYAGLLLSLLIILGVVIWKVLI